MCYKASLTLTKNMETSQIKTSIINLLKKSALLFAVFIMFGFFLAVFQARSKIIGGSWIATGLNGESISSIAIDTMKPSSIYAKVDRLRYASPGIPYQCPFYYKSIDEGANWVLVEEKHESDTMCASQPRMQWLWVDPTDPLTLYINAFTLLPSSFLLGK